MLSFFKNIFKNGISFNKEAISKCNVTQPSNEELDYLHDVTNLVDETAPIIKNSTKDKNIVLVTGVTGSGKSTIINYLMGCDMEFSDGVVLAKEESKNHKNSYPKIGHTDQSETTYPEAYPSVDGIIYCDCPGFDDNRVGPVAVVSSLGLEFAIKYAASIQAILVVIDYRVLGVDRGVGFKHLNEILGQLLGDRISDHASSVFFVFTRALEQKGYNLVPVAANTIKKRLENSLPTMEEDLKNKHLSQEQRDLLITKIKMYELICQNEKNIIPLGYSDSQCRGDIIRRLKNPNLKPISKTHFNWHFQDKHKQKLYNIIERLAIFGREKLQAFKTTSCTLTEKQRQYEMVALALSNNRNFIKTYSQKLEDIRNKKESLIEECDTNIENLENNFKMEETKLHRFIEEIDNEINTLKTEAEKYFLDIEGFKKKLNEIDTDDLVMQGDPEIVYITRGFFDTLFGWPVKKDFVYTHDFDFIKIEYTIGKIEIKKNSPNDYYATYTLSERDRGSAKFTIFRKKRNLEKEEIKRLNSQIIDINNIIIQNDNEIEKIENEKNGLNDQLNLLKSKKQSKIISYERNLHIESVNLDINRRKINQKKKDLDSQKEQFNILLQEIESLQKQIKSFEDYLLKHESAYNDIYALRNHLLLPEIVCSFLCEFKNELDDVNEENYSRCILI